jgi:hypothetical protein
VVAAPTVIIVSLAGYEPSTNQSYVVLLTKFTANAKASFDFWGATGLPRLLSSYHTYHKRQLIPLLQPRPLQKL